MKSETRTLRTVLGGLVLVTAAVVVFAFRSDDPVVDLASPDVTQQSVAADPTSTTTTSAVSTTTTMTPTTTAPNASGRFGEVADETLARHGTSLSQTCDRSDPVQDRILREYGAVFVTQADVTPPPACVFTSQAQALDFQTSVDTRSITLNGMDIHLQSAAIDAIEAAASQARAEGLRITPRHADGARRDFDETVEIWLSRVEPNLSHYAAAGVISSTEAQRIRGLEPVAQVPEILALEQRGIWFSTYRDRTILAAVAAPGTSQHLSMLALDVVENKSARVRAILAANGWHPTVDNDQVHFTFLGVTDPGAADLGLRAESTAGRTYWVPDL